MSSILSRSKLGVIRLSNHALYKSLSVLEPRPRAIPPDNAPTFIVCPPRSGSTVVMQLMTTGLDVSYFTDALRMSYVFAGRPLPAMTAHLSKRFAEKKSDFESSYGHSGKLFGPAEGDKYWKYWFGMKGTYTGKMPEQVTESEATDIINAVRVTEQIWGKPFVNKTTALAVYIRSLATIFPDALFIDLQREPVDVAQSLLKARKEKFRHWLGPMPESCHGRKYESVLESVCHQIVEVKRHITGARRDVGDDRFLDLGYEDVCNDPIMTVDRIGAFMNKGGSAAARKARVPEKLSYSTGKKVDDETYQYIVDYFSREATPAPGN